MGSYNNLAQQTVECLTFFSFKKSLHPIEHLPSKNFQYFWRKVFLMWHCNMVGNSLIIFLSKTLIFYAKMSEWAIPSTKWVICSFLVSDISKSLMIAHFWEQPERFAHSRYFVMSDLSNSLTSLFQKEGMSESLVFYYNFFKYKIVLTLFKFFWVNWRNCSFFVRERATWANFWVSVWFWFPLKASSILHSKVEEYYLDAASLATVISVPVDCEPLMKKQKQEPNHSEGFFFTCYLASIS